MQSRRMSAVEAITNVFVGWLVAMLATLIILPVFGYAVTGGDALGISVLFTLVSLVRSYALRRAFNVWAARHG